MKNIIKITAGIVFAALLLVSCSEPKAAEVFDEDFELKEEGSVFEGMTFRFGSHWLGEYYLDVGVSESGDKMLARYKETEEHFNIKMEFLGASYCGESDVLANSAAGMPECIPDIIDVGGGQAYSMYKHDLLYPFDEISTMDVNDEKFGHYGFIAPGTSWGGHRWGVIMNNWQKIPQFPSVLIVNNQNVRNAGAVLPYEYMENNEWTWANFETILDTTTRTVDGKLQKSLAVFIPDWFCETVILSNGGKLVDESGSVPKFAMNSPEAVEALEWAASLMKNGWADIPGDSTALSRGYCFDFEESYHATHYTKETHYANCLEDYGVLLFPWGPKAEYGVPASSLIHGGRRLFVATSLSENDMENVGSVMNFLFEPLDGDGECAWKEHLNYILHHPQDVDNFVRMCDNVSYTYSLEFGASNDKIMSALTSVFRGKTSPAEFVNAVQDAANAALEDAYGK